MSHTLPEHNLMGLAGVQDSDVGDVRKLRSQAARSFGSNRVMAATDLLTVEVRPPQAQAARTRLVCGLPGECWESCCCVQ